MVAPESPKYLYSYKRFAEARESLQKMAKLNRLEKTEQKYLFDSEVDLIEKARRIIPIVSSSWNEGDKMNNDVAASGNGIEIYEESSN